MRRILLFFLSVSSVYTFKTWCKTLVVTPSTPVLAVHSVVQPVTLKINNPLGNVQLIEGQGSEFRIQGLNLGAQPVHLHLSDSDPTQLDVSIDYSRHQIQTLERRARVSSVEALHIQVLAPKDFLNHVKIESQLGNIRIEDSFSNFVSAQRKVLLISDSGDIDVANVIAGGGFQIKAKNGRVSARSLRLSSGKLENLEGEIVVEDVVAKSLFVNNKEGSVSAESGNGGIQVNTQSGSIQIRNHQKGIVVAKSETGGILLDNSDLSVHEQASSSFGLVRSLREKTQSYCGSKLTD